MKNRWTKILCVLFIGLMCVSMSACQTSKKTTGDSLTVDKEADAVETDETNVETDVDADVEADVDAETAEDADNTEADVIEESTMDFDEFIGDEEEQEETVTDTFPEQEDENIEIAE